MIGNVIAPFEGYIKPPSPDDYFDPVTHIATEENFIKFLQAGIYTVDVIGYKVQLSNSVEYNNGLWVIADVNHDSANTGQSNCYDLISQDCFYNVVFRNSSGNSWRNSTPRTWLNNTFYPGFNTKFKNHMLNLKYNSQGNWYTDDKVILPSKVEINGGTLKTDSEGIVYPIFTGTVGTGANTSRKKYQAGTTSYTSWWTRSRSTSSSAGVWYIYYGDGSMESIHYSNPERLAPLMRVS